MRGILIFAYIQAYFIPKKKKKKHISYYIVQKSLKTFEYIIRTFVKEIDEHEIVLVSLTQIVRTMHNICMVRSTNLFYQKKRAWNNILCKSIVSLYGSYWQVFLYFFFQPIKIWFLCIASCQALFTLFCVLSSHSYPPHCSFKCRYICFLPFDFLSTFLQKHFNFWLSRLLSLPFLLPFCSHFRNYVLSCLSPS